MCEIFHRFNWLFLCFSFLACVVTNEVPEQPVVSPVSGAIFERRIIEKYLLENGVDPITGKELRAEELIEVKVPAIVRPKPPSATSIPAALKTMQDEWDALMLHTFSQRQQLQTARQELSHALYQHDAACRVIARLNKEVAAAREALATLKPQAGILASAGANQQAMDIDTVSYTTQPVEQTGMTPEIIEKLQEKATVLTEERRNRGRTLPKDLVVPDQIKNFKILASHPVNTRIFMQFSIIFTNIMWQRSYDLFIFNSYNRRVSIRPVYLAFWLSTFAVSMTTRF